MALYMKHFVFKNFKWTVNARASCARGREFESQKACQIFHSVATVSHRFYIYASSCVALALWRGDGHCKLVTRFGV